MYSIILSEISDQWKSRLKTAGKVAGGAAALGAAGYGIARGLETDTGKNLLNNIKGTFGKEESPSRVDVSKSASPDRQTEMQGRLAKEANVKQALIRRGDQNEENANVGRGTRAWQHFWSGGNKEGWDQQELDMRNQTEREARRAVNKL